MSRGSRGRLVVVAVLLAACTGRDAATREGGTASADPRSLAPQADTLALLTDRARWVRSTGTLDAHAGETPRDRGTGVFRITSEGRVLDDSLVFRLEPSADAPALAVVRADTAPDGSRTLVWAAAESLTTNVAEFRYETVGIPLDSVSPDGRWARALYGFNAERRPRSGWLAVPDTSRVEWWDALILELAVVSIDSTALLYDGPERGAGQPARWGSYDVRARQIEGDWMKVEVQVPGDQCEAKAPKADTLVRWLRWRDARGRPLVWYAPRGC